MRLLAGTGALCVVALGGAGPAQAAQPSTWNFAQADIPAAQPLGNYGRGVLVAVVDSWVDGSDRAFGGRVVDEASCVSGQGSCTDHHFSADSCTEGTHVAGTVASSDYGVAPEADILAVQVLTASAGGGCTGSDADMAAAISFAVAKGAEVIDVAVPPAGPDPAIVDAVAAAANAGVVVVVASSPDGLLPVDPYGSNALVVAATGPDGQVASYSGSGSAVSVAAPGGDSGGGACSAADCIESTLPGNSTGLLEGTAMAAAHVSGVAALLLSQYPGRGQADVAGTIEGTARSLAGGGAGLIDAGAALRVDAAGHPPVTTTTVAPSPTTTATTTPASTPATTATTVPSTTVTTYPSGLAPLPSYTLPSASQVPSTTIVGVGSAAPDTSSTTSPGTTLPGLDIVLPPGSGGTTTGPASGTQASGTQASGSQAGGLQVGGSQAGGRHAIGPAGKAKDFLGHHAAVLIIACLLVAGDVLVLSFLRRTGDI